MCKRGFLGITARSLGAGGKTRLVVNLFSVEMPPDGNYCVYAKTDPTPFRKDRFFPQKQCGHRPTPRLHDSTKLSAALTLISFNCSLTFCVAITSSIIASL
ncbi:hypothetical protein B0H12DRAFT_161289 [Mycena haematopus]|nr:hypothetical protein B0H12DRAFT_161289 [Mycena haematopus]